METDIKVINPKSKPRARTRAKTPVGVVTDINIGVQTVPAPAAESDAGDNVTPHAPSPVARKVLPNVVYEEPHHGKLIAVAIVGSLGIIAVLIGAFSVRGKPINPNPIDPSAMLPATEMITPTEAFVVTNTIARKSESSSSETTSLSVVEVGGEREQVSPANFKSFSYDAKTGKKISVSGTCHDAFYTLLIFNSKDDYRINPTAALTNRAFECEAPGLFTLKMDLRDINLQSGEYYLFIADQGKTGSWYNPR